MLRPIVVYAVGSEACV